MLELGYLLIANAVLATLFAFAVWSVSRKFRRPAVVHLLWVLVLVRMLMPPVMLLDMSGARKWASSTSVETSSELKKHAIQHVEFLSLLRDAFSQTDLLPLANPIRVPEGIAIAEFAPAKNAKYIGQACWHAAQNGASSILDHQRHIMLTLMSLWAIGLAMCVSSQILSIVHFHKEIREISYASRVWQKRVEKVAERMGLKSCPKLMLVRATISPMLWGFGKRTQILFPELLLESLSKQAQNTLIAHELAHYRRGDQWVRLIELLATACFWWHPVLWIARHEIECVEEQCCDALAVKQANGSPRTYAEALLATVDFVSVSALPPTVSPATRNSQMTIVRDRLQAIMSQRSIGNTLTPDAHPSLLVLAALVLVPFPILWSASAMPSKANATNTSQQNVIGDHSTVDPFDASSAISLAGMPLVPAREDPTRVATSFDGSCFIRLSKDHLATFHNPRAQVQSNLGVGRVASVCFSHDNRFVAVGTLGGEVQIMDCKSGELRNEIELRSGAVSTLCFASDDRLLAVGTRNGLCKLIDLKNSGETEIVRRRRTRSVDGVRFSDDGQWAAVIWNRHSTQSIEVWNLVSGRIASSLENLNGISIVVPAPSLESPSWFLLQESGKLQQWTTGDQQAFELEERIRPARIDRLQFAPLSRRQLFREMNQTQ